jgi:hypothetical protein
MADITITVSDEQLKALEVNGTTFEKEVSQMLLRHINMAKDNLENQFGSEKTVIELDTLVNE